MNLGCGDIGAGLRLAWKIYEFGFAEDSHADTRHQNFRNDIYGFHGLLQDLDKSLKSAKERYDRRGIRAAHDPLSADFDAERRRFIGDFQGTLRECETILQKNKRIASGHMPWQNIPYHLLVEPQIDELRRRLHFHTTKTLLVINRLSIDLLTDIDAKVDDILAITQQNLNLSLETQRLLRQHYAVWVDHLAGNQPPAQLGFEDRHVSESFIQRRLEENLGRYGPSSYDGIITHLPLAESFDNLLRFWEQSLEGINGTQTADQYLSLLKTRWLLSIIMESDAFEAARPGYYYKRAINQILQAITDHVRCSSLLSFDQQSLLALPDTSFEVWIRAAHPVSSRADPTIPRADEQEIRRLDLASDGFQSQDKVMVFRRSENEFRILLESNEEGVKILSPQMVDAREDKLIPRYALPSMESDCWEMAIFSRRVETLYRFHNAQALYQFQSALTGYEVCAEERNVEISFTETTLNCKGRVQIIQDPISFSASSPGSTTTPAASPVTSSPSFQLGGSVVSSGSRNNSIVYSVAPTTVNQTADGFEVDHVKLPALTVFTKIRGRFTILYLELDENIQLTPEKCGCFQAYDKCPLLVLQKSKDTDKFPIRYVQSGLDAGGKADPNSFDLWPFRLSQRSSELTGFNVQKTTYMTLKFRNLEQKKRFHEELELRFRIRGRQVRERDQWMNKFQHRQDRPTRGSVRRASTTPTMRPIGPGSRTSSFGTMPPDKVQLARRPPLLSLPDTGMDFEQSYVQATNPRLRTGSIISRVRSIF